MANIDNFFKEDELLQHYEFRNNKLPIKHDCLLCVVSRTNKKTKDAMTHNLTVNNLAKITEDIWNKADCCYFTQKHISKLFDQEV